MRIFSSILIVAGLALAGCNHPADPDKISAEPASAQQFQQAKSAADICVKYAGNASGAIAGFKSNGFYEAKDERLDRIASQQRATILERELSDVIVLVGSSGGENGCIVGLKNMTPQQSYSLALPMAKKFNALTNEERGQGLAKNAVQAWGSLKKDRIVYLAAYKTWDVLPGPGAAVRLLYIDK